MTQPHAVWLAAGQTVGGSSRLIPSLLTRWF